MNNQRGVAVLLTVGMVLWVAGCSRWKPQTPSGYLVDTQTTWHTVALTPQGMHYGVDLDGVSRNGPIRTVWLQKRSANRPYLYDKWQVHLNCADKQSMWALRTVVENNQVTAITHNVTVDWDGNPLAHLPQAPWQLVTEGGKDALVMQQVCAVRP